MARTMVGTDDPGIRILIIGQDWPTAESIREAMAGTAMTVAHVAENKDDAIKFLERDRADVILLPTRSADRSGLDIAREILRRSPDSRIVAVGPGSDDDLVEASQVGIHGYVAEDVGLTEVITAIHAAAR